MHLSRQRSVVLGHFRDHLDGELSGADLMRLTGFSSGSLYPILIAFEEAGLLDSHWESQSAQELGRPRRRLYRLTSRGLQIANHAVELQNLISALPEPSTK
jgi:DNA-binding PadR family transcriptional regulator